MSSAEATHDRHPDCEDLVAFPSFPMGEPWEEELQGSILAHGAPESFRQRSDTVMTESFPSWAGLPNTSTVCEERSTLPPLCTTDDAERDIWRGNLAISVPTA
jgi:hypothetical protein